ncbi:MAG: tRNA (adenosine(37)-N6)-threonylcarbamoyltransferase complex dimerization subunit type 1 TsaB [Chlorobium sp.]|nr:tRNA (adenosine(37)-N6)-threonylcarbamoyltransferase complex dimerization subunit type 1 TsaB [Chlorobium phaeovibrioides]NQU46866.1 tRNA (adenosine(37)-N6)-threonylcarbamoyltransferase complex dimerization subunit type 1 TsaB [Chlorobium sp.]
MRNILAVECTHELLSVALLCGGRIVERRGGGWQKTAESIVPLMDEVVAEGGIAPRDLEAVAVSSGPGSFTALRIGMSAVKGAAFALDVPLLAVPTLPALGASLPADVEGEMVMAVVGSRKGEYFHSLYRRDDLAAFRWHDEVRRGGEEDIAASLRGCTGTVVAVGRNLEPLRAVLDLGGAAMVNAEFFSAASLFDFAIRACAEPCRTGPGEVEPDYRQSFGSSGS